MRMRSLVGLLTAPLALGVAAVACASSADPSDGSDVATDGDTGIVPRGTPPPAASPAPGPRAARAVHVPRVVDFGEVTPFEEVTLDVPEGAVGMNIVVRSEAPAGRVGILRITSPTGECVHDRYIPKGGSYATGLAAFGGTAAAEVPQGQGMSFRPLAPGTWRIVFGDSRYPTADGGAPPTTPTLEGIPKMYARAVIQLGAPSEGFVGARLDLVVHVPDGLRLGEQALDAARAAADPGIGERLDVFFGGFAQLFGVDRGDVRFVPAPASMRVLIDHALGEAFAVSRGMPDEQALHVVLTNEIAVGMGGTAWGVAPGIPGAAMLSGTPLSAVVLAVGDTPPDVDGLVLLHETGHFFGLSHTSEMDGRTADPLADTVRCTTLSPADPATVERCPDRFNLMFPTFTEGWAEGLQVSDAQRDVVRGSPVLRTYTEADPAALRTLMMRSSRSFSRGVVPVGRPLCGRPWKAGVGVEDVTR